MLTDPHKRAIYDTVGSRGLEVQGWELAERRFSPEEVREEFKRLIRQREEMALKEQTNPNGGITLSLNATDLFRGISEEDMEVLDYDPREFPYVEMSGLSMHQSIEAPLTLNDRAIIGGSLQTSNGRGGGALSASWRRLISNVMWAETSLNYGDDTGGSIKLTRTFSKYMFGSIQTHFLLVNGRVKSGAQLSITRQLAKRFTGTILLKIGLQNSVTTSLIFDDSRSRHIVGALVVGDGASFLMLSYTHRFRKNESQLKGSAKLGTFGVITDLGFEAKVSQYNRFGCSCRVILPNGHLSAKIKFIRASQEYQIDVLLCDSQDYLPRSFVWGVVVPAVAVQTLRVILKPVLKKWMFSGEREAETAKRKAEQMEARRNEAKQTIDLMRETALKIRDQEAKRKGLVIVEALYGKIVQEGSQSSQSSISTYGKVVDVTVPLQTLVKDSKLLLYETTKAALSGFFDPCPGEEKYLRVVYQFKEEEHSVTVRDDQPLFIPKKCT